jgi:hypothetical protein
MELESTVNERPSRITLAVLPTPYKVLTTCIIATLAFGMLGALGQIGSITCLSRIVYHKTKFT